MYVCISVLNMYICICRSCVCVFIYLNGVYVCRVMFMCVEARVNLRYYF